MSRSLVEAVVPLLGERKLALDDKETLDLLRRFFACLAPGTLRPVDTLLAAVLNSEVDLSSHVDVQRWLGFIVVALPVLTNQSPEEGILGRIEANPPPAPQAWSFYQLELGCYCGLVLLKKPAITNSTLRILPLPF